MVRSVRDYRPERDAAFTTFLHRVLRQTCSDEVKAIETSIRLIIKDMESPLTSASYSDWRKHREEPSMPMIDAVLRMPERDRLLVEWRILADVPIREVAEMDGIKLPKTTADIRHRRRG